MKKLIIPAFLMVVGTGGGAAAGYFLKPFETADTHSEPEEAHDPEIAETPTEHTTTDDHAESTVEYAKLSNQFIIPVLHNGKVDAMVVMALSLEVGTGKTEMVYAMEPRLRDAFFNALLQHANLGGFDGDFTSSASMRRLRETLEHTATTIAPDLISDVLVMDIARQDV